MRARRCARCSRCGVIPDHQRERHGHHRRDPRRRQRHAGRAGGQPHRGRRAGPAHRPARALSRPIRARIRRRRSCTRRAPAIRRSRRWPAARAARSARGGMLTKILAAKRAARSGASTVIASGTRAARADAARRGRGRSARARSRRTASLAARKQWLADHVQLAGQASCSTTAPCARWCADGKSLLPIGVLAVEGSFERGEVVGCYAPDGREIARGLVNYGAQETARILRKPSAGDRVDAGLRRRAGAHPPRQPGRAGLTREAQASPTGPASSARRAIVGACTDRGALADLRHLGYHRRCPCRPHFGAPDLARRARSGAPSGPGARQPSRWAPCVCRGDAAGPVGT